jgi:EmrB/QacA subfamily drug resistance transporter
MSTGLAPARAAGSAPAAQPRGRILAGVMLSIFLGAMESTVVATAMPTVVEALGGMEIYSWVFSGFLLTSTVTMPLWGRLSDLFGRRAMYLIGMATFLAGSALSGLAASMVQLIAFRMVQGVGAGSLITLGMTIVGDLYGLEERARKQGYISGVWGVASLAGPLLGGALTDHASWRWVFYINVPFGLLAMAMIGTGLSGERAPARRPAIDGAGLVLFACGVTALLLGALEAGRPGSWARPAVLVPLVGAGLAGAAFVGVERRAREPIVPLGLFGNRTVLAALVTGFLSGMAMFGAISFVPLFMQAVLGQSAMVAGFVLTPFVLAWVAMSVTSARLVLRTGYRGPVVCGMMFLMVAFMLFSTWAADLTRATAMIHVGLAGVGMGLVFVPMLIAVQGAVPRHELGLATSVTQFFRTIGGALGVSIMGAVMAQRLLAGQTIGAALHGVFAVGAGICGLALLSALLVPPGRARDLARTDLRAEPSRAER